MMMIDGVGSDTKPKSTYKAALQKRWLALWPATAILLLYPVSNCWTRLATLLGFLGLYSGMVYFLWDKKIVRYASLIGAALLALFLLLPPRSIEPKTLRQSYIDSLGAYTGTRYVWGGENRMGIDCSGLVRSGLIVAEWKEGIFGFNPGLAREGISLWWNDCSARALGEEYQHRTRKLFSSPSINELDYSRILPGDFAVTDDGVHVLAYLGEKTWIEADPGERRVIKVQIPSNNPWFSTPVNVLRWVMLDKPQK